MSETTEYPFRGAVRITLNPTAAVAFPLRLRIPAWAAGAAVQVNGKTVDPRTESGWAKLEQTWNPGDTIELDLQMSPRVKTGYRNSVSIERGPLVFSYPITESWVKLRTRGMTADWQVFPAAAWNYALFLKEDAAHGLVAEEHPVGGSPFTLTGTPVKLQVPARRIASWRAEDGVVNDVPESPAASDEADETITLVPYGAAKLRITAFPRLKV